MQLKSKDMDALFKKLEVEKVHCEHHIRGYYTHNGKRIFPIYYSFGRKQIPKFVAAKISRSMGLSSKELYKMAKCKISSEEYAIILKERGLI